MTSNVSSRPKRLLKNSLVNVCQGMATASMSLVLPPLLLKYLHHDYFAIWVLILQMANYILFLDFGIQTAVAKFVAEAEERGDKQLRDKVIFTAAGILLVIGIIGYGTLILMGPHLGSFYTQVPPSILPAARNTLNWVGAAMALSLPFAVLNAVFVGLQRNELAALNVVAGRITTVLVLWALAKAGFSISIMGIGFFTVTVLMYLLRFILAKKYLPDLRFHTSFISVETARMIWRYSYALIVWNIAIMIISGLDLVLVGKFSFQAVTPYSISLSILVFIAGVQNAIFSVLMPESSAMNARNNEDALGKILIKGTKYSVLVLLSSSVPLMIFSPFLLSCYLPAGIARDAAFYLRILLLGKTFRLMATGYTFLVIGTGQQNLIILPPIIEASVNILGSIFLGIWFGATGVALGSVLGALTGILFHFFYNLPRTKSIKYDHRQYLSEGYLRPIAAFLPLLAVWGLAAFLRPPLWLQVPMYSLAILSFAWQARGLGISKDLSVMRAK